MRFNNYYIALGSNMGDRFKLLQDAITTMHDTLGTVKAISKVYQTPAHGFNGDDFYNACIRLDSRLEPNELLVELLKIENAFGRTRSKTDTYESRTLDLDILLYNNQSFTSDTLTIPHPEIQQRLFVLQPLADIASEIEHPVLGCSILTLAEHCKDTSTVKPLNIWLKNPIKNYKLSNYNFLAIEGNIGAGKTSLAQLIAEDFNAKLITERYADNAFLPKFYENPKRYSFLLEMSFLADRYQQLTDDLAQLDLFKDFIVSDYDVNKSLIFSKVTLDEDEFKLYRRLFHQMHSNLTKPDLYVYLYQNTERLLENIKKRGRGYEQNIDSSYLEKINSGYLQFLKDQTHLNVKIIDVSDMDFISNRTDYIKILDVINTSSGL